MYKGLYNVAFVDTETTGLDSRRHSIWELAIIRRRPVEVTLRGRSTVGYQDTEYRWLMPLRDDRERDPKALEVGRWAERTAGFHVPPHYDSGVDSCNLASGECQVDQKRQAPCLHLSHPDAVAHEVKNLLQGTHLVGANPAFDAGFLQELLEDAGQKDRKDPFGSPWNYHLVDIEALALGYLHGQADGRTPSGFAQLAGLLTLQPEVPPQVAQRLPYRSHDLTAALGVADTPDDELHTALGDARWVRRVWDRVTRGDR